MAKSSKRIWWIVASVGIAAMFWGGVFIYQNFSSPQDSKQIVEEFYTCSMHPQVLQPHPGNCPICGMRLIKKVKSKDQGQAPQAVSEDLREVSITPLQKVLGQVATSEVKKQELSKTIRAMGIVAFDRDLYVAGQEYLSALRVAEESAGSQSSSIRAQSQQTVKAARQKLLLLGMSRQEIASLKQKERVDQGLYLPTANSDLWLNATIYEQERSWIEAGDRVEIIIDAYPDEVFVGKVRAINPVLDAPTRSFTARIQVRRPKRTISPSMFAHTKIRKHLGEHLSIPVSSVMQTGDRKIVWVEGSPHHFVPREVQLGKEVDGYFMVRRGLELGERIVTQGGFLIDSEAQLRAYQPQEKSKPEGMTDDHSGH